MGAGAGLPYNRWENILGSLILQFRDAEDCWRPNTWVMVVERRPVFLLEMIEGQLYFTGPPSWGDHSRRMMLAWQASLVHFFLKLGLQEIRMTVPAYRSGEVTALERLGCCKEGVLAERSGTYYQYICRASTFLPVI
jgi:hypothetical protein